MFERVPLLAALLVRHASAYGDLVAEDLGAAWAALGRRLWVGAILAAAVLLFVEMACVWVIAMSWNTLNRQWVIGALATFFLAVACAAAVRLRTLRNRSRGVLQLSSQEWEKDQRLLAELLSPAPAGMP